MNKLDALLILNAIPGLSPSRIRTLVEHLGSFEAVVAAGREDIVSILDAPEHVLQNIIHFPKDKFLLHEYNLLRAHGVCVLTIDDEHYPEALREIPDAPAVLYVRGNSSVLKDPSVAIVGSRHASLYGLGIAQKFAMELAQSGLTIVSGLARGIDTAAHQGALKANGVTVAVLGCGLSHIYPLENKKLSQAIAEGGAVISEFPMETPPASFNFPRRNRIISGLSKGVVVVEAALKSGALITSDFALEQGREVFAVPGRAGELGSEGTNKLIKQGAKLTTCVEDILEELAPGLQEYRPSAPVSKENIVSDVELTPEERVVCSSVNDEPVHLDELAGKTGLTVTQAALVLFQLELKKLVRQLPGQKYQKNPRGYNGKIASHR